MEQRSTNMDIIVLGLVPSPKRLHLIRSLDIDKTVLYVLLLVQLLTYGLRHDVPTSMRYHHLRFSYYGTNLPQKRKEAENTFIQHSWTTLAQRTLFSEDHCQALDLSCILCVPLFNLTLIVSRQNGCACE